MGAYNYTLKKRVLSIGGKKTTNKDMELEGESLAIARQKLPVDTPVELNNDKGRWFIHRASLAVTVYGCFGADCKGRKAKELMKLIADTIAETDDHEVMNEAVMAKACKSDVKKLVEKYAVMAGEDELTKALEQSKRLIGKAHENYVCMAESNENTDVLVGTSRKTRDLAIDWQNNTKIAKDEMTWLNKKSCFFMIVGISLVGALLYLYFR